MWVDIVVLFFFQIIQSIIENGINKKIKYMCSMAWELRFWAESLCVLPSSVCVCVVVTLYIFIHPSILIKKPFKTEKGAVISFFWLTKFHFIYFELYDVCSKWKLWRFANPFCHAMTDIRNHTVFNKQSKLLNGRLPLHPIRKKQHTKMWIHKQ